MNITLILITMLFTKHFIVDFPLQGKFQYSNKGIYGHPGGVFHAWLHGMGTLLCFYWYAPVAAWYLAIIDGLVHYHIDWAKVNINARFSWLPNNSEKFWWLLGFDQYLHALTYIILVSTVIGA